MCHIGWPDARIGNLPGLPSSGQSTMHPASAQPNITLKSKTVFGIYLKHDQKSDILRF